MQALQSYAESAHVTVRVETLPGTFAAPNQPLAYVIADAGGPAPPHPEPIAEAFVIKDSRTFDEDPRFGLIVLSEIASRALSSAVNDPGTAIDVIGRFVRLFAGWYEPCTDEEQRAVEFDRVQVPTLSLSDMFDDAFSAIARDGAGTREVALRLQKAFEALATTDDPAHREIAHRHAALALQRAELAMQFPPDLHAVRQAARFATAAPPLP